MLNVVNLSLGFGKKMLFEEVSLNLTPGNCYGVIGANGAGKSTFLKLLSSELEPTDGHVSYSKNLRMATLRQDQSQFDHMKPSETVIQGHKRLHEVMKKREELFDKKELKDADSIRLAELEIEFADLGGWQGESEAATLLSGLGLADSHLEMTLGELDAGDKVRVLLAQAVFANPDILLLDEPTNGLDFEATQWLEEFLYNFKNLVIVVSHDRHFLDRVCTHIADIDFGKITLFTGNYSFWRQASDLALKQRQDQNRKTEDKAEELKAFIARFSANASKSRQATSRKKLLEKLTLEDIRPSLRQSPFIQFKSKRKAGNNILEVHKISKKSEDRHFFENVSFTVDNGDRIAIMGPDDLANSTLMRILGGETKPNEGTVEWGQTMTPAYLPRDNGSHFESDQKVLDWLWRYAPNQDETAVRSFLGQMLFSGDDSLKAANVLSGGERVRCMLARMMLLEPNALILDEPTNHLDLETISALNDAIMNFSGAVILLSRDRQFVQTLATRIWEIHPKGLRDYPMGFADYIARRKKPAGKI